jgi:hypothetical protein
MSVQEEITEEDRTNEVGLFNVAESYWRSGAALHGLKVDASHAYKHKPVEFLYVQAVELYLKSFLRGHGLSARELKTRYYGHRVDHLSEKAISLGLPVTHDDRDTIDEIVRADAIIGSRYIRTGSVKSLSVDALDRTCRSLRENVVVALKEKGTPVRI